MTLAKRSGFSTRELVLYGLLGGLMTASQVAMAALPNIHIVGVLVLLCAQVFGLRALYPVYIFVTLEILIFGMGLWAINYLYVWAILVLIGVVLKKTHAGRLGWAVAAGVFGMIFGAALAHNFGLAGSADSVVDGVYKVGGIKTPGMVAVCIGFVVLLVISLTHLPKKGD